MGSAHDYRRSAVGGPGRRSGVRSSGGGRPDGAVVRLHREMVHRWVPEWSDVPYVTTRNGRSTVTRIWEGDGLDVLADLLDSHDGEMTALLDSPRVEEALIAAAAGHATLRQERTLQQ